MQLHCYEVGHEGDRQTDEDPGVPRRNSQAIRVPKALELPEGDVLIEPRDGGLFISTLRGRWDLFFSEPGVELPFSAEELRHHSL